MLATHRVTLLILLLSSSLLSACASPMCRQCGHVHGRHCGRGCGEYVPAADAEQASAESPTMPTPSPEQQTSAAAQPDSVVMAAHEACPPHIERCGHGSRFSYWWHYGHQMAPAVNEPLIEAAGTHDLHPVPTRPVFAPALQPMLVPAPVAFGK
ncbi:MAG: hypothetical protein JSS27_13900 [Planctomycetes bacterium]|nr:hypothetical protein [Planctomycetota bacterium]